MDHDSASPPPRHAPPHIRLNSGSDDLLQMAPQQSSDPHGRPAANRQPSTRSLTQPSRPGTAGSMRQPPSNRLSQHHSPYGSNAPAESAELLLPPRKSKTRRFRDEESPMRSPMDSGGASFKEGGYNSRRTSWSSESAGSRDSRYGGPFTSPFDDSRAPSRTGSDDDDGRSLHGGAGSGVNTQTVSEKYNILPSAGLLLFPEDVEKDDAMHNPDPSDKDGKLDCHDLCSRRGLVNMGGLMFITLGILILFIGYPILTFVQAAVNPGGNVCATDPMCISDKVSLLNNLRSGMIDPDTPQSAMQRKAIDGTIQNLVFSDEFNEAGRTFYDGDDPYFQAVDLWYGVTRDLEWYDPDAVTTANGTLTIRFDAFQNHNLNYRSGMIQSWNQLCFKGGFLEASISLPGRGDTMGFWPGFWAMGNLGRPGYAATTDGLWPYSYHDECDIGITPNQSDPDGLSNLPGMRLPACTCMNQDHPSPGYSRSAPEIDAIEASVTYLDAATIGAGIGTASQSYQVAPFDILWRPNTNWIEIYDAGLSSMNAYQGGVFQQALSTVTNLNNDWYNGNAYQTYGFEYQPGGDGYVVWNVGDTKTWKVEANAVGPNGNIGQRVMPEEPMAIVANFGMSNGFAVLNLTGLAPLMPATMRIDYIRIYQGPDGEMTCDPQGYPTTPYIKEHIKAYTNPNLTLWSETGYSQPKNSLMHGCTAEVPPAGGSKMRRRDAAAASTGRRIQRRSGGELSWWQGIVNAFK